MIYDCFTFFNELDLLEIRLNTLNDVVDRFVISEATRTHRGQQKELVFEKHRARFAAFEGKITYVIVDDLLSEEEVRKDVYNLPWVNENRQRNALIRGLASAASDDVVLLSDVDEIPRPESVVEAARRLDMGACCVRFEQDFHNYYLNFKNYSYPKWMIGTVATKRRILMPDCNILATVKADRYTQASENAGNTLNKLRFVHAKVVLPDAGWHFSYLGGIDAVLKKISAFSHSEFSSVPRERLEQRLALGEDLFGRAGRSFGEIVDSSYPSYVVKNQEGLSALLFPVSEDYLRNTARSRRIAYIRGRIYALIVSMVPERLAPCAVRIRDSLMRLIGRN